MRLALLLLVVISFAFADISAQDKKPAETKTSEFKHSPDRVAFDPSRDAQKDINAAIENAKKAGKHIILDVGGEWCIWCHRLDKLFEDNKDLTDYMRANYIVVKVNYSKENKNEKVLSQYPKVAGYPHLFVLDKEGKLLHSQNTGDLENGKGHDKEKVMEFLKKWAAASKS